MTSVEDQVRAALHDMADEARSAPLLQRLESRPQVQPSHLRMVVVAAAAVVVAIVAATSYVLLRPEPSIIEPVKRPPKVFRLSDTSSSSPGRALMAVTLARTKAEVPGGEREDPIYLLPASGGPAVHIPVSAGVSHSWSKELSTDGSRLIRRIDRDGEPRLEVVELETGRIDVIDGQNGECPQLSPDNRTVALYGQPDARIIDVRSGASETLYPVNTDSREEFPCGGLGWSPNGSQIVIRADEGSVVVDRQGRVLLELPRSYAVNSSMSWSPDGRLLLTRDRLAGGYQVVPIDGGATVVMRWPTDALRPLGWAGQRVVWLAGQPGDYRLVTTDQRGDDVRTWMRFEIGDRPIDTISWSRDLSGRASDAAR
jgi:hypothetical protein